MSGVTVLEELGSREGCHRATPWSCDGEILHLRRKKPGIEQSQQKDPSLRKPESTPEQLTP